MNFTVIPYGKIVIQRFAAAFTEIDDAFFIAFAENTDVIFIDIGKVQIDQFRYTETAGHKKHQDGVITVHIRSGTNC